MMPPDHLILACAIDLCVVGAGLGCAYLAVTISFARRFVHGAGSSHGEPTPVTILKPLHGEEPDLLIGLASFCNQNYPGPTQFVFGCHDHRDGAIAAVRTLRTALPEAAIDFVSCGAMHGCNRKISNLINMAPAARYDALLIADSDIVVGPDYLADVMAELATPGVGAVTCLYHGVAGQTAAACFSALTINCHFLPNVLLATALDLAQPCFGATIALRRATLDRIGSFHAFADTLADDHAIGKAVRAAGLRVAIPSFSVGHVCNEKTFREFFDRQLRHARTIKSINPIGYAGAIITNPLPLALLAMLGGNSAALFLVIASIAGRLALCRSTERALRLPRQDYWLLPAADLALFAVFVSSFFGSTVTWRGHRYRVTPAGSLSKDSNRG